MTVTRTARLGLALFSQASDAWPGRAGWNELMGLLEGQTTEWAQGELASRPAAGTAGRVFWAIDAKRLYWDDGASWTETSPVGGGGLPQGIKVGAAGAEGTSRIAARADHTHPLAAPVAPQGLSFGGATAVGTSEAPARADHVHALPALPARAVPFDYNYGGDTDQGVIVGPGGSTDMHELNYNIAYAGAVQWLASVPIVTESNAAGRLVVKVNGVVRNRTRWHSRNRATLFYVPVPAAWTNLANTAVKVTITLQCDAANTGNVTAYDSPGYFSITT